MYIGWYNLGLRDGWDYGSADGSTLYYLNNNEHQLFDEPLQAYLDGVANGKFWHN